MSTSSQPRVSTNLSILIAFHIIIIAASNYLVQIPVMIAGFHSTYGTFTFPLIFLATDLTVRLFGADKARRVIFLCHAAGIDSFLCDFSALFRGGNFKACPAYQVLTVLYFESLWPVLLPI